MPRKPRFFLPGVAAHVVQRGHSRNPVFFDNNDYQAYLDLLYDASRRYQCRIHAYVLMTNHVHLLVTPEGRNSISLLMQSVNRHYVPYINYTYGSSGSIWEGRFKASIVEEQEYLIACMRYIELNPVRASMVHRPEEYRWSSFRCNGLGVNDKLVSPHKVYLTLGSDTGSRLEYYRALFEDHIDDDVLSNIRKSCNTGTPLGNDYFRDKVEQKLKCKVGYMHRGRPGKRV